MHICIYVSADICMLCVIVYMWLYYVKMQEYELVHVCVCVSGCVYCEYVCESVNASVCECKWVCSKALLRAMRSVQKSVTEVCNRKCTVRTSKFSSRIFAQTHLGLQTRVVPKLVIVHPGHSVHQKIANQTLWKEKDHNQLSGKYFLKTNKKLLPLRLLPGSLNPSSRLCTDHISGQVLLTIMR